MPKKRRLTAVMSTCFVLAGLGTALAAPADAAVNGTVDCVGDSEVSVWVQGPQSGWATLTPDDPGSSFSFDGIATGASYQLRITCGWGAEYYTPYVSGVYDWYCNTSYGCFKEGGGGVRPA